MTRRESHIPEDQLKRISHEIIEADNEGQGFVVIMDLFGIEDWRIASILLDEMKEGKKISHESVVKVINYIISGETGWQTLCNSIFDKGNERNEKFMHFMIAVVQSNGVIEFEESLITKFAKRHVPNDFKSKSSKHIDKKGPSDDSNKYQEIHNLFKTYRERFLSNLFINI